LNKLKERKLLTFILTAMKKYLLSAFLITAAVSCFGQNDRQQRILHADSVQTVLFLGSYLELVADPGGKRTPAALRDEEFRPYSTQERKQLSKKILSEGYVWFRFRMQAGGGTPASFYVTTGSLTREIVLYQKDKATNQWKEINGTPNPEGRKSYARFGLAADPEIEILGRARFAKTNVSLFSPSIINSAYINYHLSYLHSNWYGLNTFTYLLVGTLLMMLLFSAGAFVQNRRKEFLYYSLYAMSLGSLLCLKAITHNRSDAFTFFNEEYLDFLLLLAGYIFYLSFSRYFLNTRNEMPVLNRLLTVAEGILFICLLVFTGMYFGNKNYDLLNTLENSSKYFMIFIGVCFVVLGIRRKNKIWNYLVAGNLANLFMAGFSQYLIIVPSTNIVPDTGIFRQSLLYFELGILLEMLLFLAGLNYKNKIELIERVKMKEALKQERERKEFEKQIAVLSAQQEERSRIAADMHDELGSGVTAIRLLSEIARRKTKDQPLEELSKISFNANDLMMKMNGIIWSMNPGHDSLDSFISYIRSYASEYCETVQLQFHFDAPAEIPQQTLAGNVRRNLFLVIKESLNNIIKHAEATDVTITIQADADLDIMITDNGKGIDDAVLSRFGNGLKNMARRMESIGGTFSISSNQGTTTRLKTSLNRQ